MAVTLSIVNDFLSTVPAYYFEDRYFQSLTRGELRCWLVTPSLNGGTISYAEVHDLKSEEEIDLAVDLLIVCGIGSPSDQKEEVHPYVFRPTKAFEERKKANAEDRKEETRKEVREEVDKEGSSEAGQETLERRIFKDMEREAYNEEPLHDFGPDFEPPT